MSTPAEPASPATDRNPLRVLIGGPRGALESVLPPLVFVATFELSGSIGWAVGVALAIALVFAIWRMAEGKRPTRAMSALLIVAISAYVAVATDSAVAFFWPRVLVNLISALAFAVSILVRWPLLTIWLFRFGRVGGARRGIMLSKVSREPFAPGGRVRFF